MSKTFDHLKRNELKNKLELEKHLAIRKLKEHPFHNSYYEGYLDAIDVLEKYIDSFIFPVEHKEFTD
jgi:hypothetical protein